MRIEKNMVVSLNYELSEPSGQIIEKTSEPVSYLHGGYDGIFPMVEEALHSQEVGYSCSIVMDPENTFGEYDSELIRIEPRDAFPDNVAVGMQFEGDSDDEDPDDDPLVYTVTDVAEDKVVVDGNHPLAGKRLQFDCTVTDIRQATTEEIAHGHAHDPNHHHH